MVLHEFGQLPHTSLARGNANALEATSVKREAAIALRTNDGNINISKKLFKLTDALFGESKEMYNLHIDWTTLDSRIQEGLCQAVKQDSKKLKVQTLISYVRDGWLYRRPRIGTS